MKFLIWVVVNALALSAAVWLLDGITIDGATSTDKAGALIVVALIFGVINAVIRPVVKLLSLPFIILTLGLLIFVINAVMLLLTSWVADKIGVGFHVDGFWTAVFGAVIVMVVTWGLQLVLPDGD
ncbi:MAG: phage holin family protein [Nocardioidaceae bacterium]